MSYDANVTRRVRYALKTLVPLMPMLYLDKDERRLLRDIRMEFLLGTNRRSHICNVLKVYANMDSQYISLRDKVRDLFVMRTLEDTIAQKAMSNYMHEVYKEKEIPYPLRSNIVERILRVVWIEAVLRYSVAQEKKEKSNAV